MNKGKIIQIIGPVVDVEFPEGQSLPDIYTALKIDGPKGQVILEVVKHLDQTKVKTISLQSTDGLQRGQEVENTGKMIEVPVGQEVLGHLFDVCGNVLNEGKNPTSLKLRAAQYTIEPKPEKVLEKLAEHLFFMQIYHLILEANASEHSARRMAMKTASDNAKDLGENLNLQYNKSRQSRITTEISEISAGAEALS